MLTLFYRYAYAHDNLTIDSLLEKYPIRSNEALVIVFMEYGACIKCLLYPLSIIDDAEKLLSKNLKVITLVNCERAKEIRGFNKILGWEYPVEPDIKRQARYKLGCKPETDICLIDSSGKVIAEIQNFQNHDKNLQILTEALKKLN